MNKNEIIIAEALTSLWVKYHLHTPIGKTKSFEDFIGWMFVELSKEKSKEI